jgi:hypothetical protein
MPFGKLNIQSLEIEPFAFIPDFQTRVFVQYANIVEKSEIGRSVVEMLDFDPRVIALKGKLISRGNGAQTLEVQTLAMWFLWCANELGPESAKAYLDSFLDAEEITVLNSLWVLGLEVDQPIILNNEYAIQPIDQMPDSRDKEHFLQSRFQFSGQGTPVPTCAITRPCRVPKVLTGDLLFLPDNNSPDFLKANRRLHDIALLLNALSGISCLPYYSTSYVDPTTPFGLFGGSGGGSVVYDVLAQGSSKLRSESKTLIDTLLAKYEKLSNAERARIQRILNRLSQAKRRAQIEDKILDLGIALEMLLLDDNRNHEQLSLSFRLRGSWLLGKSTEDRIEKYQLLKKIYIYRSQVAHGGILCNGKAAQIKSVQQSFSRYQSLAENICQKLIMDGKPDWDKLLLDAV